MKTIVSTIAVIAVSATASFAGVGDIFTNSKGQEREVTHIDVTGTNDMHIEVTTTRSNGSKKTRQFTVERDPVTGEITTTAKGKKAFKDFLKDQATDALGAFEAQPTIDERLAAIEEEDKQKARVRRAQTHNLAFCPDNTNSAGMLYNQPVNSKWSDVYRMCGGLK